MLLRRVISHIRAQNWLAVFLDFIIVVVGVFIGIQLGNWNEARADREREQVYLEQLLIDLDGDVQTGERGVQFANRTDADAELFLAVLENEEGAEEISDADLVAAVPNAGYAYLPYGVSTTYNEMISTGALGLMDDVDLKRELGNYYGRMSVGRQWDDLVREEQYAYRAAIRGILTREQFAWARANTVRPKEERTPLPAFDREAFLERARARPEIIDTLRSMGAVQERLRNDSATIKEQAEIMSDRIREAMDD